MDRMMRELEVAIDSDLYYLSVMLSLIIPDICAALESPDGETRRSRYEQWVEKWFLSDAYKFLSAADLYQLRCGVLHQGRFSHPKATVKRVIFTLPGTMGQGVHHNLMGDALQLSAAIFARDMIAAVHRWQDEVGESEHVKKNLESLMKYHPNGLLPYFSGLPVIA